MNCEVSWSGGTGTIPGPAESCVLFPLVLEDCPVLSLGWFPHTLCSLVLCWMLLGDLLQVSGGLLSVTLSPLMHFVLWTIAAVSPWTLSSVSNSGLLLSASQILLLSLTLWKGSKQGHHGVTWSLSSLSRISVFHCLVFSFLKKKFFFPNILSSFLNCFRQEGKSGLSSSTLAGSRSSNLFHMLGFHLHSGLNSLLWFQELEHFAIFLFLSNLLSHSVSMTSMLSPEFCDLMHSIFTH